MQMSIKKSKWNRKKIITFSIVGVVIIAIVTGVIIVTMNNASKSTLATAQRTTKVKKGNIEVSITGSGTITSSSTSDLMSNADGKITKAYFSEGDTVKKGDLLYEIDDTDAKLNIQKIENSISQAQLSVNSNQKNYNNLTIIAPFSGKVTNISAEAGENVNNGMSLFTITETSKLKLSVPFSTTYTPNIKVGQKAQVHLQELMDTVDGVVTAIDDNLYTASNGGTVKNIEITVSNPGSLTDGMTASVDISTSSGLESGSQVGALEYANKKAIQAATSGTFSSVNVKNNQYVNKGDVLIQIENDDLQITSQTNDLKMQDLNNQLTAAQKELENYKVYSPIDGTISAVSAVVGDSVKSGSALISIRDFNQMQFTISVDELDIAKVEVGQEVSITVDALTETEKTPLSGEVIYKAMEGTSSNGVAVYDVTVKINEAKNLLAGMNANAKIILNKAENALIVPLEAVTKMGDKAFVWVKGASGDNLKSRGGMNSQENMPAPSNSSDIAQSPNNSSRPKEPSDDSSSSSKRRMSANFTQNQEYYANATMKSVEIGLNSDEYIEIKSGLSEGDEVILPPLVASSNGESSAPSSSGGFNMGGFTGGMGGGNMGTPPDMPSRSGGGSSFGSKQSSSKGK